MGILDDAIREHLDLKRRRGADPSEIDRLEREALGPVRRAPHDTPDLLTDDEEGRPAGTYPVEEEVPGWDDALEEPAPFDHAGEPPVEHPTAEAWPEPAPPSDFEAVPPPVYEAEPEAARERRPDLPRHHEIAEEWEAHERQSLAGQPGGLQPDEPAPAPPIPPPAAASHLDAETAEYQIETDEELEAPRDEAAEGEDVLEETPDFLQDTPDHDRLWFEQRPPRDFDFDG